MQRSVQVFNSYFTSPLVGEVAAKQRVRGTVNRNQEPGVRNQENTEKRYEILKTRALVVLSWFLIPGSWCLVRTPHPTLRVDLSHKGRGEIPFYALAMGNSPS
jgi:hypothetical protein